MHSSSSEDDLALFQQYLSVCNTALEKNKDRFPFKQILGAMKSKKPQNIVEVQIIDDVPAQTFMLTMHEGTVVGNRHCDSGVCKCDSQWKIRKSYLQDVVNNSEVYIQNPAKIDWEWVYSNSGA